MHRERGDSDRDRRRDRLARRVDVESGLAHRGSDALGNRRGILLARVREQERELLPAEPRGHVVRAELVLEDPGDPDEHRVAGQVAVAVVDLAQEIQVGDEDGGGTPRAARPLQHLLQYLGEVTRVVELRLRILPCLGFELREGQRPLDEDERREREQREPRVVEPDRGEHDAEQRDDEIRRNALRREEAALAERVPARQLQDLCEEQMVDRDEDDPGSEPGEEEGEVRVDTGPFGRGRHARVHLLRGQGGEPVVRDVERLDVPGISLPEPLRDVLDDDDEREERRRQQDRGREHEDGSGLVRLVPRRDHDEELGDRRPDREEHREPPVRRLDDVRGRDDEGVRADGGRVDGQQVELRPGGESDPPSIGCCSCAHRRS